MNRARVEESLFRNTSRGREPLAPPGEGGNHIHYQSPRHCGIGCITSRRPGSLTTLEYLAIRHGLTLAQVMKLLGEN